MKNRLHLLTLAVAITLANAAHAQIQGPSTGSTPYVVPLQSYVTTTSIFTVDNVTSTDDSVGGYGMVGIPDGLGAFQTATDVANGTFTLLMNHEISSGGATRAHGATGAFVSQWTIRKSDFTVLAGSDLITSQYDWNTTTSNFNTSPTVLSALQRLCSADLAPVTAFYNASTGLGSQVRLFLNGEEGGPGRALATVASGADAGKSYVLGALAASSGTNSWENLVANPFQQDKTIVIGMNDNGGGAVANKLSIYQGLKNNSATTEPGKAGLIGGVTKYITVTGNPVEITNNTTRTTGITSGAAFTLDSAPANGTAFSRPEDGAWDTITNNKFYFVTTDQYDQVSDNKGSTIGRTRLWALNFTDITNPDLGGTVDLLLDRSKGGYNFNMFDNITVGVDGTVYLQEDVGGNAHNGKVYAYNPTTDTVTLLAGHDVAWFGDLSIAATSPFNNDEETSGIIDISAIMGTNGITDKWLLTSDQAHYAYNGTGGNPGSSGITVAQVEGGQLVAIHVVPEPSAAISLIGGLGMLLGLRRRRA